MQLITDSRPQDMDTNLESEIWNMDTRTFGGILHWLKPGCCKMQWFLGTLDDAGPKQHAFMK